MIIRFKFSFTREVKGNYKKFVKFPLILLVNDNLVLILQGISKEKIRDRYLSFDIPCKEIL